MFVMCWTRTMLKKSWFPPGTGWCPSWIPPRLSCDMAQPCRLLETRVTPVTRSTPLSTQLAGNAWLLGRRPASAPLKDAGKKKKVHSTLCIELYWVTPYLCIPALVRFCMCFVFVSGEQQPCWQLARAWCRHGATSWTTPCHWCGPTMMSTLMCFLCWMCVHWNTWPTFSKLLSTGLRPWTSRPLWTPHRWTERGKWRKQRKMLSLYSKSLIQRQHYCVWLYLERGNISQLMFLQLSFLEFVVIDWNLRH